MSEKIIVLDTETANGLDCPFAYDIGFVVTDYTGKVYEQHSYAISDIIFDDDMMDTAYYKDKLPQYWQEIKDGVRELKSLHYVKSFFYEVCAKYDISKVYAHNARFDWKSCTYTQRYITKSAYRYFFPKHVSICDTLKYARNVMSKNTHYRKFCKDNGYLTKNKQNRYTAEVLYRYISKNPSFNELHKGIDDVLIEKEILKYCYKKQPEFDSRLWAS